MESGGNLFFIVFAVLAFAMLAIPKQWALLMKAIYRQRVAPRNIYIRAVGVTLLLILWLIYNDMKA
jgi:hypothetical protein